jgi:hypothetical protein
MQFKFCPFGSTFAENISISTIQISIFVKNLKYFKKSEFKIIKFIPVKLCENRKEIFF